MGAQHLSACEGKLYWELRVVVATGWAGVGFAGTNFRCGSKAPQSGAASLLGGDEASWALYVDDGKRNHRWPTPQILCQQFS